jgi:Zn-dependent protease with chaperone function
MLFAVLHPDMNTDSQMEAADRSAGMQEASSLLVSGEQALNRGDPNLAARFFHEICDLYPETMERIAALCYLRATRRREPRPASSGG